MWLAQQASSLLLRLFTPVYVVRVWQRGRQEPSYRIAWPQRLGFYGPAYRHALAVAQAQVRAAKTPLLWVHAVSLGETLAAKPLIAALRDTWPGMRLVLTHSTATGREAGQALLQDGDVQTWLPYDTPGAVRRFLRLHQPALGVLMETEIWPNLQREALSHSVPMVLANARLSEKSLRQALRFAPLLRPAAQSLSMALAQTQADAQRLSQAGVAQVEVCGNVKFDLNPAPALLAQGRAWAAASERPMVLAAVTREGEEATLLAAWVKALAAMQGTSPGVRPRLMIVPRH
ncbi:MAG: glycosyltransferase N-terminal domain-containing protein, partial [Pseudomonadota bacterium]